MNEIRGNLLSLGILFLILVSSVYLWGSLPEQVPSHFNILGEVDGYSPRWLVAALVPSIYASILLLINLLPRFSPRQFAMPNSGRAVDFILAATGIMLFWLHLALLTSEGDFAQFTFLFTVGVAMFMVMAGSVFGATERNFFLGVRLPWTLSSDANWRATHRFMGALMVAIGLALLGASWFYSNLWVTVGLLLFSVLAPVVFSGVYHFRYERD